MCSSLCSSSTSTGLLEYMKHTSPHRIVVCFSFICAHLVELCCEMVCTQSESEVHSTKSLSASASLFSFFFFPFIASIRPFTCALDLSSSRYQSAFGWCIDRKYCKPVKLRYTRKKKKMLNDDAKITVHYERITISTTAILLPPVGA